MVSISLCMIVKNEESVLSRCLESVKDIVDEIIIIDTGSTDKTIEIAHQYTEHIYNFKWIDDFSEARNFSFLKAKMDYVMWLDADDVILENDRIELLELKRNLSLSIDAIMMKYNVAFDDEGNPTFYYYRERILKREKGFVWKEPVHECIELSGNIIKIDTAITHKKSEVQAKTLSMRNLNIYKKELENKGDLSIRGIYYYARELKTHNYIDKAIEWFEKFLNYDGGWFEDKIQTCLELSELYKEKDEDLKSLKVLYNSFVYDLPRAEICCRIGEYYMDQKQYSKSIYWYKMILSLEMPETTGFIQKDFWDFIPLIQLCVLYDRLGNKNEAIKYHLKTKEIKPNDISVKYNNEYFG